MLVGAIAGMQDVPRPQEAWRRLSQVARSQEAVVGTNEGQCEACKQGLAAEKSQRQTATLQERYQSSECLGSSLVAQSIPRRG